MFCSSAGTKRVLLVSCLFFFAVTTAWGADYQFGVDLPKPADDPTLSGTTHAFLWVPPHCEHLRAVVLAPANIIEREFCDDPQIRSMAEHEGVALLFFQSAVSKQMPDEGFPHYVQTMLDHLADVSGIAELRTIPWIPVGHSGNSQFVAKVARYAADRVVCTVVIKGALQQPAEDGSTVGLDMPMLLFHGEYEEISAKIIRNQWWDDALMHMAKLRAAVPHALVCGVLDRSFGHLWWSPELSAFTVSFIQDSLSARLPDGAASSTARPPLRAIAWNSGWLVDQAEAFPSAPVDQYKGDPAKAFWVFDEAMAKEWKRLFDRDRGKKDQLLAFVQDGRIAPSWNGWGVQALDFEPESDGESFKVKAVFRDSIPAPIPGAGTPLGHADPSGIYYKVVGWAGQTAQTGPDTFAVRFDREGVNGRTTHIVIGAIDPGDNTYRATMVAASMTVPGANSGAKQTISFPQPPDVPASTATFPLKATVDSSLPVRYYVSWGPAEVEGDSLRIVDVPDHAAFPIGVKVTAYQWGKAGVFATAASVVRTFHITK
jgi:hypothetical protein